MLESPYTRYPVYRESLDDIARDPPHPRLVAALNDQHASPRSRARGAAPAGVRRARDEGPRRAARGVPARRTSTWRSSSTSTARRRASSRSRTCSRRSSATSRTSSTSPTSRSSGSTRRRSGSTASFTIDDFNEQFGTRARRRGLPHRRRLRVRPPRPCRRGRRRGRPTGLALPRARDERLADPAARGRVPARAAHRGRRHVRSRVGDPPPCGRLPSSPLRHRDFALYVAATVATAVRRSRWRSSRSGGRSTRSTATRSTSGSSGSRCSSRCRCSRSRPGHLADRYPRRTMLAARGRRSTRWWRSACSP